jgi:replication factor C subunit 1
MEAERLRIPRVLYTTVRYCDEAPPLWADLHAPKKLSDVLGHGEQIRQLLAWLTAFPAVENRVVLITGPPGIGKTTVAHLVAVAAGFEVIERNASDERSGSAVRALLETSTQSRHVGKKRVLIMDEVDGSDRGGVAEIARLGKAASFPLLCIANERSSPKLKPLLSVAMDVRFSRPSKGVIAKALRQKNPTRSLGELELLVEQSGNDIRACWNALQIQRVHSTDKDALLRTDKDALLRTDVFSATGRLFQAKGTLNERSSLVFVDSGIVPLMVAEGYVAAAERGSLAALDRCAEAADWIGLADVLDKRIHRTQSWDLMTHSAIATVAAATVVEGPAPFQLWPQWLGKQSKRTKHKTWIRSLESRSGLSLNDSRDLLRLHLGTGSASERVDRLQSLRLTRDDFLDTLLEVGFPESVPCTIDSKTKAALTREWTKRCGKSEVDRSADCVDSEEEEDL